MLSLHEKIFFLFASYKCSCSTCIHDVNMLVNSVPLCTDASGGRGELLQPGGSCLIGRLGPGFIAALPEAAERGGSF